MIKTLRILCLFIVLCLLSSFEGVAYRHFTTSDPWSIHILEVDPNICEIFPVHANDQALGRDTVLSLADQHQAIAGVNGGFFKSGQWDGVPAGALKINQSWYGFPSKPRGAIGWSMDARHVLFDQLLCSAAVIANDQMAYVDGINRARGIAEAILFTPVFHASTLASDEGFEIIVKDDRIAAIHQGGNHSIPQDGYVISIGSRCPLAFWKSLSVGNSIKIKTAIQTPSGYTLPLAWNRLPHIVGGVPILVRNGKVITNFSSEKARFLFIHFRHARTAVGILPNGRWLFVVVDGGQPRVSKGMTIPELAQLMYNLGCKEALNLDGGGSSTMVLDHRIINSPRGDVDEDNGKRVVRKVSDAILIRKKPPLADYRDFDRFQDQFTKPELELRIQTFLQKDAEIRQYFHLTDKALFLYASPADQAAHRPEYTLSLLPSKEPYARIPSKPKGFKGLKIAIDPGHFGGSYARLEERFTLITSPLSEEINFCEGTLTLLTAKILKNLLEQEGAQVLLTKEEEGSGAYGKDFSSWLKEFDADPSLNLATLFRAYYNPLDLKARASKINAFHPDLTVIIHYNTDNGRDPQTQENIPSLRNYNMTFVGGSFCKGELKNKEDRYHFLRLLLTSDLDTSICLSQEMLKSFSFHLGIPPVKEDDYIPYLENACMRIQEGLYARNLILTRLIQGPLCYGETLCQDNVSECFLLNKKDLNIDGIKGPKRAWAVALAYFNGIKKFIEYSN